MKIVSHKPPRHLDDYLAIAYVSKKLRETGQNVTIEYIHPQDEQAIKKYKNNPEIFLIDVGGSHNVVNNNYDHHQDINIPSSIALILERFNEPFQKSNVIKIIDYIDRAGFPEASKKFGLKPDNEINKKRTMILQADLSNEKVSDIVEEVLQKAISNKIDNLDDFIIHIYESLDKEGLLEEIKEKMKKEEEDFKDKIKKAEIIQVSNGKDVFNLAFSKESFAPNISKAFSELEADIIIERNSMNPEHTSIIKNSNSEIFNKIDLNSVFEKFEKVFIHPNGFIAVLNKPVEELIENKKDLMRTLGLREKRNFNKNTVCVFNYKSVYLEDEKTFASPSSALYDVKNAIRKTQELKEIVSPMPEYAPTLKDYFCGIKDKFKGVIGIRILKENPENGTAQIELYLDNRVQEHHLPLMKKFLAKPLELLAKEKIIQNIESDDININLINLNLMKDYLLDLKRVMVELEKNLNIDSVFTYKITNSLEYLDEIIKNPNNEVIDELKEEMSYTFKNIQGAVKNIIEQSNSVPEKLEEFLKEGIDKATSIISDAKIKNEILNGNLKGHRICLK